MRAAGVFVVGTLSVLGLIGCTQAGRPESATAPATVTASSSALPTRTATPSRRSSEPARTSAASPHTNASPTGTVLTTTSATAAVGGLPLSFGTADAGQVVTVTAAGYGDTQATLQAWTRTATDWRRRGAAIPAWLGYAGFSTQAREGFSGTPVGSFGLTQAFGTDANPGVRLPYFRADADDWWNGDSASPGYNTHQRCLATQCPFRTGASENLHAAGWVYGYAAVIDYNTAPVRPGGGSAFFLHVTENHPTQGCVSIARAPLVDLLRWLDPARHPRILMGVG